MDETKNESEIGENNNWLEAITKSMYEYVFSNDEEFWKEIEIEAKLGKVLFEGKCEEKYSKILFPYLISGRFRNTRDNFITFDPSISKEEFLLLFEHISNEFADKKNKIIGPIKSCDLDGRGYRKSIFGDNRVEVIKKINKTNFDIRNCGKDIRFSISREKKYNQNKNLKLTGYVREKSRISFYYDSLVIDFTIVNSYKNKVHTGMKFEVELEFFKLRDNPKLYKEDYKLFENVISEICEKMYNFYNIINKKEGKIQCDNLSVLMKKFNLNLIE